MKKYFFIASFAALLSISFVAYAQSTASQIIMGSLSISGCPGGNTPCFIPYSSSNPLPVVSIAR